jgi:non-ribosomal peptide synthase protein (TIGR01720 family)
VAPRTPPERILADIWADVLERAHIGIHDNFFELGGDSILAIVITARAARAGIQIAVRDLFEHQTVAKLAAAAHSTPAPEPALRPLADDPVVEGDVPLTPIQLWNIQLRPADVHKNVVFLPLDCQRRIDPSIVQRALAHVIRHHDALRLRVWHEESGWRQWNAGIQVMDGQSLLDIVDLTGMSAAEERGISIDEAAERRLLRQSEAVHTWRNSIEAGKPPLLRALLLDLGSDRPQRLVLGVHHFAFDVVSMGILLQDLQQAYLHIERGELPRLPEKTSSFQKWARGLAEYAASPAISDEVTYWRGLPWDLCEDLPRDHVDSDMPAVNRSFRVSLDPDQTKLLLRGLQRAFGVRLEDLMLSALVHALVTWTGRRTFAVDILHHGRVDAFPGIDVSRTVGWFSTAVPAVLDVRRATDPESMLRILGEQVRAVPKEGIGYGVVRYLRDGGLKDLVRTPEIQMNNLGRLGTTDPDALFRLQGAREGNANEPAWSREHVVREQDHLISLTPFVQDERAFMVWTYRTDVYRESTARGVARDALAYLQGLIASCEIVV